MLLKSAAVDNELGSNSQLQVDQQPKYDTDFLKLKIFREFKVVHGDESIEVSESQKAFSFNDIL